MANSMVMNGHFSFHYDENLTRKAGLPCILVPPQSQCVAPGTNVTFTVEASGGGLLSYQWRLNGNAIPNAILPSLTVTNAGPQDAGTYSVLVTNSLGSQTSSGAGLTVISVQPTNLAVLAGQDAQFVLLASPPTSLRCQWQFGGTNIPGATNATLLLSAVTKDQAGQYVVTVTNAAGQTASSAGTLLVCDPSAASLDSPICLGGGQFQFDVTGAPGLAYVVEVSTNLVDWEPLTTNTPPFAVVDQVATNSWQRFYRAICPR